MCEKRSFSHIKKEGLPKDCLKTSGWMILATISFMSRLFLDAC
jgi:hypothetical protein